MILIEPLREIEERRAKHGEECPKISTVNVLGTFVMGVFNRGVAAN